MWALIFFVLLIIVIAAIAARRRGQNKSVDIAPRTAARAQPEKYVSEPMAIQGSDEQIQRQPISDGSGGEDNGKKKPLPKGSLFAGLGNERWTTDANGKPRLTESSRAEILEYGQSESLLDTLERLRDPEEIARGVRERGESLQRAIRESIEREEEAHRHRG